MHSAMIANGRLSAGLRCRSEGGWCFRGGVERRRWRAGLPARWRRVSRARAAGPGCRRRRGAGRGRWRGCAVEEAQQFHRDGHDQSAVLLAATSTTVCSSRSCKAAGSAAMTAAAWASFLDAWYSPSAEMIRARRSRSASACRDIERFIDSGRATSLTSTRSTRMPQGCSVEASITSLRWALTLSRSDSSWSMSLFIIYLIGSLPQPVVGAVLSITGPKSRRVAGARRGAAAASPGRGLVLVSGGVAGRFGAALFGCRRGGCRGWR